MVTDTEIFEGIVNPLSGDYHNPIKGQFECWLVINDKCYKVGYYHNRLPKEERLEASRMIWKAALGLGD